MIKKKKALCAFVLLLLCALFPARAEKRYEKKITDGLNYIFISRGDAAAPVLVHVLEVDMYNFNLDVVPILAWGRIGRVERVSSMVKRHKALAGINGGFYDKTGGEKFPIGYLIQDGKLIYKSDINRTVFGLTEMREVIIKRFKPYLKLRLRGGSAYLIEGVNRPRSKDGLTLYTPHYGRTTRTPAWGREVVVEKTAEGDKVISVIYGNAPIPENGYVLSFGGKKIKAAAGIRRGDFLAVEEYIPEAWSYVKQMVTGGPLLVDGGKVAVTSKEEGFFSNIAGTNARTAVGVTKENKLLLVVVEGKKGKARKIRVGRRKWKWVGGNTNGLSFYGIAKLFVELGAEKAMGLDSGGSSTMVVGGVVVNKPADGAERAVSNGILVMKAN